MVPSNYYNMWAEDNHLAEDLFSYSIYYSFCYINDFCKFQFICLQCPLAKDCLKAVAIIQSADCSTAGWVPTAGIFERVDLDVVQEQHLKVSKPTSVFRMKSPSFMTWSQDFACGADGANAPVPSWSQEVADTTLWYPVCS